MRATGGGRIEWIEVPARVRDAIGAALGSPVVDAVNPSGGFSPGVAARCRLADGGRVLVKAVSPEQNRQAARIHRREAEVTAHLPGAICSSVADLVFAPNTPNSQVGRHLAAV